VRLAWRLAWLLGCEACLAACRLGTRLSLWFLVLGSRCDGEGRQTGRAGGPAWLNLGSLAGSAGRDWVDAVDRGCFALAAPAGLDPCLRCVVNGSRCD
jgi:hypothetical protein